MLIGSRQRLSTVTVSLTLSINDFQVTQVATAKSLGVPIDDNLDWDSHVEKIIKKVSSGIRAIKASKAPCPPSDLTTNLPSSYSPSLQLFQYCFGQKLWDNLKEQTSKTTN